MHILYVSSPLEHHFGGGEKFIQTLIEALPEDKHEFLGGSKPLFDVFQKLGKPATLASAALEPVTPLNLLLSPLSVILGLFHFLRFFSTWRRADVIVSPTSFTELFFVLPWVQIFLHKRIVFILQNRCPKAIYASPLLPILKWMWRSQQVIFMSQSQLDQWREKGVYTDNCQVIRHGTELNSPEMVFHTGQPVRLGFLSRIHKEKGLDILLKSLTSLNTFSNSLELNIAGSGPAEEEMKNLQKSLNFPPSVSINWVGFIDKPLEFYKDLDLVVFPSRGESFGLVLIEAWSCGIPVLCTNLPVFEELKNFHKASADKNLLFEKDNPDDLCLKLEDFLSRLDEFRNLTVRKQLRQTVIEEFSIPRMAAQYKAIFSQN